MSAITHKLLERVLDEEGLGFSQSWGPTPGLLCKGLDFGHVR